MISLKLLLIYFYHSKWSISETKSQIFTASPSRTSLPTQSQQSHWPSDLVEHGWWDDEPGDGAHPRHEEGGGGAWRRSSGGRISRIHGQKLNSNLTAILRSKFSKLTAIFLLLKVWLRSVPKKTVVKKVVCVSGGWSVRWAVPRRIPAGVPTISSGLWEGVWV